MKLLLVTTFLLAGCAHNSSVPAAACPDSETTIEGHGCVTLYEDGGWVKYQGNTEIATGCLANWPCSR